MKLYILLVRSKLPVSECCINKIPSCTLIGDGGLDVNMVQLHLSGGFNAALKFEVTTTTPTHLSLDRASDSASLMGQASV